jgi:hypothetical protein
LGLATPLDTLGIPSIGYPRFPTTSSFPTSE